MSNFRIEFLNSPWWLILLIPAFFLALFPHFRIAKKYRRNRNRIVSLVLHLVIVTLCIFTLSGIYFAYDNEDTSNEVLILVDMSYSDEQYADENFDKNSFVRAVIDASGSDYQIGVVTFGYNQVYAAKMSTDTDEVYNNYLKAPLPNDTASDIASALEYARSLFKNQNNAKIVLISDGAETDGDAMTAIRMLSANGIRVNTAYFPNTFDDADELLISDIELPDTLISIDDPFTATVTLRARKNAIGAATITLYDDSTENGEVVKETRDVDIVAGEQSIDFVDVTLSEVGMHKLRVSITSAGDGMSYNNTYYSYVYINSSNSILIIEKDDGYSQKFADSLNDEAYETTVVNIEDAEKLPNTLDELRMYDEVILMNIANRDMPDGFIDLLYSYVHDIGGGLFTVGGTYENEYGEDVPNMYDRNDMYTMSDDGMMTPTLYQEMLPVQSINYTPPLGVMIIIDRSGSMSGQLVDGNKLAAAKKGAKAAVYGLSERDYCGIMTLDTEFQIEQSMIEATNQARLLRTIDEIEIGGGTMYAGAIERAGVALQSLKTQHKVERCHIIFISDGEPGDATFEAYGNVIKDNYEKKGITFSMIAIGIDQNSKHDKDMQDAADLGHGTYYRVWDEGTLADKIRQELKLPEITEISKEPFQPLIGDHKTPVSGVEQADIPMLGGYFGTKPKTNEEVYIPLKGEFVPILAYWRYGEGRVGSFMCDLTGEGWSQEFLASAAGVKIVNNTIKTLLPTIDIRPSGMNVEFIEDNYSTYASIYTDMGEDDRIELSVYTVPTGEQTEQLVQKISPTKEQGYSNIKFQITKSGVYRVVISKLNADDETIAQYSTYRVFSYSEEYNVFIEKTDCENLMSNMASAGRGKVINIDEPWTVFDEEIDKLHEKFDPRWIFMIIAIVLFLLDIAVRKFKFKWIHELVRERKEKRAAQSHDTTENV